MGYENPGKMGADGAALGTLFAEFSVLIVQTMSLQSILADIRTKINLRYGMVSCAVASISIPLLKLVHFNSILTTLIMSTIVFFCSYGIVLLIQGEPLTEEFIFGKFKKNKLT